MIFALEEIVSPGSSRMELFPERPALLGAIGFGIRLLPFRNTLPSFHTAPLCFTLNRKTYTTRTVRKFHMESGRKGREVIRSRPISPGQGTKEKGNYTGQCSSLGVNSLSHITGHSSPTVWYKEVESP